MAENRAGKAPQESTPREELGCERHLTQDEVVEDGRKTHGALPQATFPRVSFKGRFFYCPDEAIAHRDRERSCWNVGRSCEK